MSSTTEALDPILQTVLSLSLSRAEKLHLIGLLADDLARSEQSALIESAATYPIWSPHDAFEAAAIILRELDASRGAQ